VEPIKLKGLTPVSAGALQFVYQHPSEPDYLIKILRLDRMRKRWARKSRGLPITRRFGLYNAWVRELKTYIELRSRSPDGQCPEFVQRHYGLTDTDLGIGLLVGKVKDRAGNLAPPLSKVVQQHGFTEELRKKFADLQTKIEALNIVTSDINGYNILLGWSEQHGDHLVIIEGLGDNTLIPVKTMFRFLNRASIRRHFARTFTRLERLDRQRTAQGVHNHGQIR
jgi:hypothetical protein